MALFCVIARRHVLSPLSNHITAAENSVWRSVAAVYTLLVGDALGWQPLVMGRL